MSRVHHIHESEQHTESGNIVPYWETHSDYFAR